jgi:serine/threonine-protein kinase
MTVTTADVAIDRVRRAGLIPPAELDAYLAGRPAGPDLLGQLVADGYLTPFQAGRLQAGKYKGFRVGGYVILDQLGAGGMGQVFLAEHADMRRLVALKVLPVPIAADVVARERFLREARAAAALDHPNIVRVFDLNKDGQLNYLVMEFVEGVTLQALVSKTGPLPVAAAADYARQVALGLQHAHERDLIHRDVKPANVLVDVAGRACLLDLGLVRFGTDVESQLTAKVGGGSILGTADYLSPEQATDSSTVDIRADIYSLGATLYFLLTGRPLFVEGTTTQKLMWQQWREPTPARELRPEVPDGLAAVVAKALAKKPAARYQTPAELAAALAPFCAGPCPPPADLVPPAPQRRWFGRPGEPPPPPVSRLTGSSPGGYSELREAPSSQLVDVPRRNRPISLSTLGTAETGDGRSELTNPTPAPTPAPVPPTTPPVVQPEPVSVPRPLSAVAPPAGSPLPVWAFAAFAAAVLSGLLAAYLL